MQYGMMYVGTIVISKAINLYREKVAKRSYIMKFIHLVKK